MRKLFLVAGLVFGMGVVVSAEPRGWTNKEGKRIEAELVSHDTENGTIVIGRGGKEFTLKVDTLSEADQEWLEEHAAALSKEQEERMEKWKALAGTTKSYSSEGEEAVSYHVYRPSNYDGDNPPPMIIMFSPGGNGKGMLGQVTAACEELGWVGVGCDVFKNGADDELLKEKFAVLLPHIEKTVQHNPERLYTGGMSGGALRAYQYTAAFKRPWKGVLAFGGWLGGATSLDCPRKMAVAIVNGDGDEAANSHNDSVQAILEGRRCKVEIFQFPGGHVVAPPEVILKAMRWIEANTEK